MPRKKKNTTSKTRNAPYVVVKQDLPWHKPYEILCYGKQENHGNFFGLFSYESFEVTNGGLIPNNPCTTFYNCNLLQDMSYYNKRSGDAKKGTKMKTITLRQHFSFFMTEEGSFFGDGSVNFELTLKGVKYDEIIGYQSIGYLNGDVDITRNKWIIPLIIQEKNGAIAANELMEGGSYGTHTLIVHFPSFEFEIFGEKITPQFHFKKGE